MRRLKYTISLLFYFIINASASATDRNISAFAYADTEQNAQQLAYASLTTKLNNLANLYRCQQQNNVNKQANCLGGFFHFDIPLEGLIFKSIDKLNSLAGQRVIIEKNAIQSIYLPRLSKLHNELIKNLELSTAPQKVKFIRDLWRDYNEHLNIEYILGIFDIQHSFKLDLEQLNNIKQLQIDYAVQVKSLDDIPALLLSIGRVEKAYIHAPTPIESVEMTPMSEMLRHLIETSFAKRFPNERPSVRGIKAKKYPSKNSCYHPVSKFEIICSTLPTGSKSSASDETVLIGSYEQLDDKNLLLHYQLRQIQNNSLIEHIYLQIPLSLTADTRQEPINTQFDKTLHESIKEDPEFHVELESTRGKRNILIYGGEDIGLKIRSDSPAYYYLVGHVVREKNQYSYLIEIGPKNAPFIAKISGNEIGQWLELGEFTVEPPFGVEHLQLVASNQNPKYRLPKTKWDPINGYHIVAGSESDSLLGLSNVRGMQRLCVTPTTRGMQRNCGSGAQVIHSNTIPKSTTTDKQDKTLKEDESVLSFTSIQPKD